jgi:hypothetical protein
MQAVVIRGRRSLSEDNPDMDDAGIWKALYI